LELASASPATSFWNTCLQTRVPEPHPKTVPLAGASFADHVVEPFGLLPSKSRSPRSRRPRQARSPRPQPTATVGLLPGRQGREGPRRRPCRAEGEVAGEAVGAPPRSAPAPRHRSRSSQGRVAASCRMTAK
jgi:hypothetical protein